MRCLGLDIGDVRIGIAISESGIFANPLMTLNRTNLRADAEKIKDIVAKHQIDTLVVGRPIHLNGSPHAQAEKNEKLVDLLRSDDINIVYWDERLSSASAERVLLEADLSRKKRKLHIDKIAAVIILQNYLDYCTNNGGK